MSSSLPKSVRSAGEISVKLVENVPRIRPTKDRMADRMVAAMVARGVTCVFGIPGGAISGIYDALMDADIRVVICQHEQLAVYMACGHTRATGELAAVAVTAGPGVLNTATSVAAAYKDEVPLLLLAGEVRTGMAGRGALQDGGPDGLDILTMFRSVTKFADVVQQAARGESLIHEAIDAATAWPMGPALLRIPLDVTLQEVPSDPIRQARFASLQPDPEGCERIVAALSKARRPAVFLGLGARLDEVGPVVVRLAERLRCPVICDVEAKGVFPESHALSLGLFGVGGGAASAAYLRECDALVTVGARLDDTTTNAFSDLLRPAFLAQLDHDARRLGLAYRADVVMATRLRAALESLVDALPLPSAIAAVDREAAVQKARSLDTEPTPVVATAPFDPRGAVSLLQAAFPVNTLWTSDIGNHLLAASRHLSLDYPGFQTSVGLGGMGSGIGLAMGLAHAYGSSRRVVGICGDGSLRMVGAELATCAKYGIPVVLAVFNDARYGMVAHGMKTVYDRIDYCEAPQVDVVAFARSLGARAYRIKAVRDLVEAAAGCGEGPVVLDVPIDPEVRILNPRNKTLAH